MPREHRRRELSVEVRERIVGLYYDGLSYRAMCRLLRVSYSSIAYTIRRYQETGSNYSRMGRGRFDSLSQSDHRYVKLLSLRDRRKTVPEITAEFNIGRNTPVSNSVIRRSLKKSGLNGRVAAKKPLLRPQNIRKRLQFAKEHVGWTEEQWARVLFTDESKFDLFGTNRRVFVRRFQGERFKKNCLQPTIKHGGGSVMIWAGISVKGGTKLKLINGIMDKKVYHQILIRNALPEGKRLLGRGFIFQEDNDPKHASNLCRNYLTRKENSGKSVRVLC